VKAHGQQGYTFKGLIQSDIAPMIRRQLKLTVKEWKSIDDKSLRKKLKEKLEYNGADYYLRKLENLKMERGRQEPASVLLPAFIRFSTPFLKIIDDAASNKVTLTKESVKAAFKEHIKEYPSLKRWFASQKFDEIGDAISLITDKIKARIETEEETQHDQNALKKSASAAGVRSDFQGGKVEPGKAKGDGGLKDAGIKKKKDSHSGDAMQKAFEYEKSLPKGMYWHCSIGRCKSTTPCTAKFCQGCGWHAFGSKGHARPNCPNRKHPDFVPKGYFHDKYPNREDSIVSNATPPASATDTKPSAQLPRTPGGEHGGRIRAAGGDQ